MYAPHAVIVNKQMNKSAYGIEGETSVEFLKKMQLFCRDQGTNEVILRIRAVHGLQGRTKM